MHFVAPLVESRYKTLLWFDAFGLALVTVAGTVKASDVGAPALVAIAMGAVTGIVGGILRDTLGHVPSVLLGRIILGVLAFWLFAQTTLNIAPAMAVDLAVATTVMNIAVSITALFSGIFIVVIGGLADRVGRVKILMWGFILGIVGSLLVGMASPGSLAVPLLMLGRIFQGLSAAFIMPSSLARSRSDRATQLP
jgi:hypothetical protein